MTELIKGYLFLPKDALPFFVRIAEKFVSVLSELFALVVNNQLVLEVLHHSIELLLIKFEVSLVHFFLEGKRLVLIKQLGNLLDPFISTKNEILTK